MGEMNECSSRVYLLKSRLYSFELKEYYLCIGSKLGYKADLIETPISYPRTLITEDNLSWLINLSNL
jgi:hypothetical protein